MKFILGKKLEMTHRYNDKGNIVPVTVIQAGPCTVTQVKKDDTDGYRSVQLGFLEVKKLNKPQGGHLTKVEKLFKYLREFPVKDLEEGTEVGSVIKADTFEIGKKIKVTAISKGKGFQGVVKRHGFAGSLATHGHKDQVRMPGSIGATGNARVFKGTRMGGRMGNTQITISNLEVVDVDVEKNLLYIKGSVPGSRNSLVKIVTV